LKKYTLDIDNEDETFFYGLLSNEKVSRIAWLINLSLDINLARVDSIEWYNESEKEYFYFVKFIYKRRGLPKSGKRKFSKNFQIIPAIPG